MNNALQRVFGRGARLLIRSKIGSANDKRHLGSCEEFSCSTSDAAWTREDADERVARARGEYRCRN